MSHVSLLGPEIAGSRLHFGSNLSLSILSFNRRLQIIAAAILSLAPSREAKVSRRAGVIYR
jgi:hypothetical protein